jgi:predicted nucleotidyltransferase
MMPRFGLNHADLDQIRKVFSRYPQVEKAILYGSRAMGTHKTGSDIDLTLCGTDDLTLDILYRIMEDLDNLLLPSTFDLSIYSHNNNPDVISHINHVGCTFYTKKDNRSFQAD